MDDVEDNRDSHSSDALFSIHSALECYMIYTYASANCMLIDILQHPSCFESVSRIKVHLNLDYTVTSIIIKQSFNQSALRLYKGDKKQNANKCSSNIVFALYHHSTIRKLFRILFILSRNP